LNTYAGVPIEEKQSTFFLYQLIEGSGKFSAFSDSRLEVPAKLFDTRTQDRNLCGLCVCQKSYLLEIKSVLLLEILGSTKIVSSRDSKYQHKAL